MQEQVNHPKHYNAHPSGVEAIAICEHLGFCLGNALKYVWRAGKKLGQLELIGPNSTVVDLEKAIWYLNYALGKEHKVTDGTFPIWKVIDNEPQGSVLRDVLELLVVRMLVNEPPRIADAILRIEREIVEVRNDA